MMKNRLSLLALPGIMCIAGLGLTTVAFAQEAKADEEKRETRIIKIVTTDEDGHTDVKVYEGQEAVDFMKSSGIDIDVETIKSDSDKQVVKVITTKEFISTDSSEEETVKVISEGGEGVILITKDGKTERIKFPEGKANYKYEFHTNDGDIETLKKELEHSKEVEVILKEMLDKNGDAKIRDIQAFAFASSTSDDGVSISPRQGAGAFSYSLDVDEPTSVTVKVIDKNGTIVHKEKAKVKSSAEQSLNLEKIEPDSYEVLFETDSFVKKARLVKL